MTVDTVCNHEPFFSPASSGRGTKKECRLLVFTMKDYKTRFTPLLMLHTTAAQVFRHFTQSPKHNSVAQSLQSQTPFRFALALS